MLKIKMTEKTLTVVNEGVVRKIDSLPESFEIELAYLQNRRPLPTQESAASASTASVQTAEDRRQARRRRGPRNPTSGTLSTRTVMTEQFIANIQPVRLPNGEARPQIHYDVACRGLHIRYSVNSLTWFVGYVPPNGEWTPFLFGCHPRSRDQKYRVFSLAEAQEFVRNWHADVARGIDPREHYQSRPRSGTLRTFSHPTPATPH